MPRIYRHEGPNPVVDIPSLDLLTFLFDSDNTAGLPATQNHVDTTDPNNFLTKFGLQTLAQRIAYGLRTNYSVGANGPDKDVVTVISNGQILVPAVFYGVLAAGGIYSAASPHSTVPELTRTVNIGTSKLIICGTEFVDVATKAAKDCGLPLSRVLVLDSTAGKWSLKSVEGGINAVSAQQLPWTRITDPEALKKSIIVILWSSGTTGLPKGVQLSHLNLVAECYITSLSGREWAMKQIAQGKTLTPYRTLAHLPISHIAGLFGYLIGPLYSNGTVFWMRKYQWQAMIDNVKKFEVTALYTVPSIFLRISKAKEVTDHFKTVEAAATGAAPMDGELQVKASSRLGEKKGQDATAIGQTWGLSETTGAVTAMPRGETDTTGCIGRILPNVELRQINDSLTDVSPGEPGELLVRSPLVTNGYFNNPTATRDAFIRLPDDPADATPWFCTGDIAILRNDKFYIVDRKKEILKYKGQQVAPAEIENLLFTHPRIQEAAVVGVPGVGSEAGSELPRAYVVKKRENGDISAEEVGQFVRERLAGYKWLRGGVVFVEELPKNAIGKFLRRELRERAKREVGSGGQGGRESRL